MKTLQDLLNISVAHVLKQGKPAVSARFSFTDMIAGKRYTEPRCQYRTEDGLGCAAAPFIVDYLPGMENKNWTAITSYQEYAAAVDQDAARPESAIFVERVLQAAHDNAAMTDGMLYPDEGFVSRYLGELFRRIRDWNNTLNPYVSLEVARDHALAQGIEVPDSTRFVRV